MKLLKSIFHVEQSFTDWDGWAINFPKGTQVQLGHLWRAKPVGLPPLQFPLSPRPLPQLPLWATQGQPKGWMSSTGHITYLLSATTQETVGLWLVHSSQYHLHASQWNKHSFCFKAYLPASLRSCHVQLQNIHYTSYYKTCIDSWSTKTQPSSKHWWHDCWKLPASSASASALFYHSNVENTVYETVK